MLQDRQQKTSVFRVFATTLAGFVFVLFLAGSLAPRTACAATAVGTYPVTHAIYGTGSNDFIHAAGFGTAAVAVSRDGSCAAVTRQARISNAYTVYTYMMNQGTGLLVQRGDQLRLSGDIPIPYTFGMTLSFSSDGSVLAVGAPLYMMGVIWLFRRSNGPEGTWSQAEGVTFHGRDFLYNRGGSDEVFFGCLVEVSPDGKTVFAGLRGYVVNCLRPMVAIYTESPDDSTSWRLRLGFCPDDLPVQDYNLRPTGIVVHPYGNQSIVSLDGYYWVLTRNTAGEWSQAGPRYDYSGLISGRSSISYSADGTLLAITSLTQIALWEVESPRYRLVQVIPKPATASARFGANGGSSSFAGKHLMVGDDQSTSGEWRLGGVFIYSLNSSNRLHPSPSFLTMPVNLRNRFSGGILDMGGYVRGSEIGFALTTVLRDDYERGSLLAIDLRPTPSPSQNPTKVPTNLPSRVPSQAPTRAPSRAPTRGPTKSPSQAPTWLPSQAPTQGPTNLPTQVPTQVPTQIPTRSPTKAGGTNLPPRRGGSLVVSLSLTLEFVCSALIVLLCLAVL